MKCVEDVFHFIGQAPVEAQGWVARKCPEVQRIISASHCVWGWTSASLQHCSTAALSADIRTIIRSDICCTLTHCTLDN